MQYKILYITILTTKQITSYNVEAYSQCEGHPVKVVCLSLRCQCNKVANDQREQMGLFPYCSR